MVGGISPGDAGEVRPEFRLRRSNGARDDEDESFVARALVF
jgi:hypothetical protein